MVTGLVIEGTINVGFDERVSDVMMRDQLFIVVFDIGGAKDVMILNKAQIVSVQPKEEGMGFIQRDIKMPLDLPDPDVSFED